MLRGPSKFRFPQAINQGFLASVKLDDIIIYHHYNTVCSTLNTANKSFAPVNKRVEPKKGDLEGAFPFQLFRGMSFEIVFNSGEHFLQPKGEGISHPTASTIAFFWEASPRSVSQQGNPCTTLPKTSIASENRSSQKESSLPTSNHPFSGALLVSGRAVASPDLMVCQSPPTGGAKALRKVGLFRDV